MRACAWGAQCVCASWAQAGDERCWYWVTQNLYVHGVLVGNFDEHIQVRLTQDVVLGSGTRMPADSVRSFSKSNLEEVIEDEHVPLAF